MLAPGWSSLSWTPFYKKTLFGPAFLCRNKYDTWRAEIFFQIWPSPKHTARLVHRLSTSPIVPRMNRGLKGFSIVSLFYF
jgi:hypothetical protein